MAYITNLTHFLDNTGNIPKSIPKEARNLASFLALVVDDVTRYFPRTDKGIETSIKCFKPTCDANVVATLDIYMIVLSDGTVQIVETPALFPIGKTSSGITQSHSRLNFNTPRSQLETYNIARI